VSDSNRRRSANLLVSLQSDAFTAKVNANLATEKLATALRIRRRPLRASSHPRAGSVPPLRQPRLARLGNAKPRNPSWVGRAAVITPIRRPIVDKEDLGIIIALIGIVLAVMLFGFGILIALLLAS
jgi:hypothetical protein